MSWKSFVAVIAVCLTTTLTERAVAQVYCPQQLCGVMNGSYYYLCMRCQDCQGVYVICDAPYECGGNCGTMIGSSCFGNTCNEGIGSRDGAASATDKPAPCTDGTAEVNFYFLKGKPRNKVICTDKSTHFKNGHKDIEKNSVDVLQVGTTNAKYYLCTELFIPNASGGGKDIIRVGQQLDSFDQNCKTALGINQAKPATLDATFSGSNQLYRLKVGNKCYYVSSVEALP